MPSSVVLHCPKADPALAQALAQRLDIPLVDTPAAPGHVLVLDDSGLWLQGRDGAAPTRVDFLDPALLYRLRTSGKRQGLGQALGLHKQPRPTVLDATAGLGRDALLMAHLGCDVLMLERSPFIHALLEDGLRRARAADGPTPIPAALARLQLQQAEAREWLAAVEAGTVAQPDIVYLDPMFPPRNKSAKVKKDIAMLQELLGSEDDFVSLLQAARRAARHRVVVKRPGAQGKKVETGEADVPAPGYTVPGKTAHFEVYLSSKASSMP